MSKKTFPIKCKGNTTLPLDVILEFQGKLKKITPTNLAKLKNNILKNGFIAPLFVWDDKGDYRLLDGHQRLAALISLRQEDYDIPMIPVDIIQAKDEAEAKKMLLSITSQYGEFEATELKEWLDQVDDETKEFLRIVDGEMKIGNEIEHLENEDDVPEVEEKETICKIGQIWKLGKHRLMCGDAGDEDNIKKLFCDLKPSIVFTDPPYGVSIGDKNKFLDKFQRSGGVKTNIENDTKTPEELKDILTPIFALAKKYCSDDCTFFMTSPQAGELSMMMMMMMMMKEAGLAIRHVLMWYKNSPTFSLGRLDYDYQHEPILLTWGKKHKRPMNGQHKTSVWKADKPRSSKEHPTMKPVELYENAYLNNSDTGDIAYEPFAGSGTAFIASEKVNRQCFGFEIDPHYCDVIIKRWELFTGNKAELIS